MTAHALARVLLEGQDLPVVINGWSSHEGFTVEVSCVDAPSNVIFRGEHDTADTPRLATGWEIPRLAIALNYNFNVP